MANSRSPPLGFLAIDVILHRPPGDPFNQLTWPFPLIREKVAGSSESQVVSSSSYGPEFMDRLVDAGKRLAERGAVGIITSCGFLAMAQPEYVTYSYPLYTHFEELRNLHADWLPACQFQWRHRRLNKFPQSSLFWRRTAPSVS
jgi:hypothetical protein